MTLKSLLATSQKRLEMNRFKTPLYVRLHKVHVGEFTFTLVLVIIYFTFPFLIPSFLL
jgi:hypothetical protein